MLDEEVLHILGDKKEELHCYSAANEQDKAQA